METLGSQIRNLRIKQGYSAAQLAELMHIRLDDIWKVEREKKLLSKWQLFQLAAKLNLNESNILIAVQKQLIAMGCKSGGSSSSRTASLIEELNQLQEKPPSVKVLPLVQRLPDFLESIVYFEKSAPERKYERIMPDGKPKLIIDLDKRQSIVVGQHNIPHDILVKGNIHKIIIRFNPYGLYLFTGISQDKLLNRVLEAEYIFGNAIHRLEDDLHSCRNSDGLKETLHSFFINKMPVRDDLHFVEEQVVRFLVNHIDEPIAQLVKKTGYSSKHLIHFFRTYTGLTPKGFQQVIQFANGIQQISLLPTHHLSRFDLDTTYFDQPHFTRQFKRFSGFSPSEYLKTGNSCSRMVLMN